MKRLQLLMVLLSVMWLSSCDWDENWFYHTVDYSGETVKDQLVITGTFHAGQTAKVYVNSGSFLDSMPMDTIWYTYTNGQGKEEKTYTLVNRKGYLRDARVEMQVNGGEWETLVCVEDSAMEQMSYSNPYVVPVVYFVSGRVLQCGDDVAVRVHHDRYVDASARQRIPQEPGVTIQSITDLGEVDSSWRLAGLEVQVPAYTGDPTDVLLIQTKTYSSYLYMETFAVLDDKGDYVRDSAGYVVTVDSLVCVPDAWTLGIYSQDMDFAKYSNINNQLSMGYWGGREIGLLHSVNSDGQAASLSLSALYRLHVQPNDTARTDSIVLTFRTMTRDSYLQLSSMVAADYRSQYAYDFWASSEGYDEWTEIVEEIEDIFDELGGMEGVQVFDNVDGGIGHVSAVATQRIVCIPPKMK